MSCTRGERLGGTYIEGGKDKVIGVDGGFEKARKGKLK